ncbi:MAG: hypothetical protein DME69_03685 [Verrucomicrobia bacterium]|nr:MAG: hypothetical protein DME69_03685 [Verrucomicrobiota bacterium]
MDTADLFIAPISLRLFRDLAVAMVHTIPEGRTVSSANTPAAVIDVVSSLAKQTSVFQRMRLAVV